MVVKVSVFLIDMHKLAFVPTVRFLSPLLLKSCHKISNHKG